MLKNLIVLPDGTEIFSGAGSVNSIRSAAVTESVNSGTELTLGSVCSNMFEATIVVPGGEINASVGDEVTLYKVDDAGARAKVGLFTLEKPTRSSANILKITGYDRISWLDKNMSEWLAGLNAWPYTLLEFSRMVCQECGLVLKNDSIPNENYPIRQFSAEVSARKLMEWAGQVCGRFFRATVDGDVEFAWYEYKELNIKSSGDAYFFGGSLSYEDYQTAAIEKVQLRLTSEDVGVSWPDVSGEVNTYSIIGNYLLASDKSEPLLSVAQTLYENLSTIRYTPCKVSFPVYLDAHAGDIVQITDRNGNTITVYAMTVKTAGQKSTLECTGSARRDSSTVVNNETITSLSGKVLEIKKSIDGLSIKAENTEGDISELQQNAEGIALRVTDTEQAVGNLEEQADETKQRVDAAEQNIEDTKKRVSELTVSVDGISGRVENTEGDISTLKQTAGQVSVEVTDENGTLTTLINSDAWKAWFVDADGVEKSGLHFDFEKGRFVFNGTGQFGGINDGDTYIAVDGKDLCVFDSADNVVMRLGVKIMPTDAAYEFPYIGMTTRWWSAGSLAKEDTLIIRNPLGLWVGNGHIEFYEPEDSANYTHLQELGIYANENSAGIFISSWASYVWLVTGKSYTNLYTGDTIARFG